MGARPLATTIKVCECGVPVRDDPMLNLLLSALYAHIAKEVSCSGQGHNDAHGGKLPQASETAALVFSFSAETRS